MIGPGLGADLLGFRIRIRLGLMGEGDGGITAGAIGRGKGLAERREFGFK